MEHLLPTIDLLEQGKIALQIQLDLKYTKSHIQIVMMYIY